MNQGQYNTFEKYLRESRDSLERIEKLLKQLVDRQALPQEAKGFDELLKDYSDIVSGKLPTRKGQPPTPPVHWLGALPVDPLSSEPTRNSANVKLGPKAAKGKNGAKLPE